MNKYHHISLNVQFLVVLDGIICYSVRFCDNSLLMLKMFFRSLASKKILVFSSERKVLVSLLSILFHLQNPVSVFGKFNYYTRHMRKPKKFEALFCRQKTAEEFTFPTKSVKTSKRQFRLKRQFF